MRDGLLKVNSNLTEEKILLLDMEPDNLLPFGHLPTAEVLRRVWRRRRDGKQCNLFLIRAELEAEVNLVRHSRYGDIAVIIDLMME